MDISIKKIVNSGITKGTSSSLEKCIRLSNVSALISVLGMLPFLLLYSYHQLYIVFFSTLFFTILNILIPFINYIGWHRLTRVSFIVFGCSVTFVNSSVLGQETLVFLYLFACFPVLILLFQPEEKWEQYFCLALFILAFILDLVFCLKPFNHYNISPELLSHIRLWVAFGSLTCLLLLLLFLRKESGIAQRNVEQLIISKQIIKNDLDAVLFCDLYGRIQQANQSAELLYGYTYKELEGQNFVSLYASTVPNTEYSKQPFSKQHDGVGEVEQRRKDGSTFTAMMTQFIVTGEMEQPVGMAVKVKDITLHKRTELALIEAKEIAEEAAIVKANFLATMSHEIRTPLNGVIGMAHLLLEDDPKPEHVDSLNVLRFAAENLLTLINDVLDFSKIDAGRITLETVPFSLSELIHSIESGSRYQAFEKGIEFNVELDDRLDRIYLTDPVRLTQVLLNLTSNAIKFTKLGGVTLSIVVVNEHEKVVDVEFKVADTGIGIAKEKLTQIFEQFAQADNTITRQYGGSGLGLAITKGLLEAFDSAIKVESLEGKGSSFSFVLRMQKMLDEKTQPAPHKYLLDTAQVDMADGLELEGLRILVAEDNPVNIMVITKILTKWGIELDIVQNGEQAVQKVREKRYHLVLMDIQMPVMDGFQATLAIRSIMKGEHLPIVALTATTTDEFILEAYAVGMNGYLGKPFNPQHLKSKIQQLCLSSYPSSLDHLSP